MADVELTVKGLAYGGWKSIEVTRSIEKISGQFALAVSERWAGQDQPWPIYDGDECEVTVRGQTIITGYVDNRTIDFDARSHSFRVSGRDKTGDLVDCSAWVDGGKTWQFTNQPVDRIVAALAKPMGIAVRFASGVRAPKPQAIFSIEPGETAFAAIDRICKLSALLPVSDGLGGLVLTRAGAGGAAADLVLGQNLLAASMSADHTGRFRTYIGGGQHAGSDFFNGEQAAAVRGTATDEAARAGRLMFLRPDGNVNGASMKERTAWEAIVRAARSTTFLCTVQDWSQSPAGDLWPINALTRLQVGFFETDTELLITEASYSLDDSGGTRTRLTLMREDAFKPDPNAIVKGNTEIWRIADGDA